MNCSVNQQGLFFFKINKNTSEPVKEEEERFNSENKRGTSI